MRHLLFLLALPLQAETLEQAQVSPETLPQAQARADWAITVANQNYAELQLERAKAATIAAQAKLCPGAQLDQAKFQQGAVACVPKPETKEISK